MNVLQIVFLIVYFALLVTYMALKKHQKSRFRSVVKMSMSFLFVVAGIYSTILFPTAIALLLCFGLFAGAIGDYFLLYISTSRHKFHCGVYSFLVCNILLYIYSIMKYGFIWWTLLIWVGFLALELTVQAKGLLRFGKSSVPLNIYVCAITLRGATGIGVMTLGGGAVAFGLGSLLFMISDFLLGFYSFKWNKWVISALNSLTYFGGLLLIALSPIL
ncbi:MAG: lysoplasmalogenase family protein [Clostridia bacterium]